MSTQCIQNVVDRFSALKLFIEKLLTKTTSATFLTVTEHTFVRTADTIYEMVAGYCSCQKMLRYPNPNPILHAPS